MLMYKQVSIFTLGLHTCNDQKSEIPGNQSGSDEPPIEMLCFLGTWSMM